MGMHLSPHRSVKFFTTITILFFSLGLTVSAWGQTEISSDLQIFQDNLKNARLEKNEKAIIASLTALAKKMDDLQRPDSAVYYYLEALKVISKYIIEPQLEVWNMT